MKIKTVSTMEKKTMKIKIAFIFLVLAMLACGTQMPTQTSAEVKPTPAALPVSLAIVEPTDTTPQYMTTGALNVRAEPNADSEILGTLAPLTVIQIYVIDQLGDDCYLGEWYQIDYKPEGGEMVKAYVCSLWVVRK